MNDGGVLDPDMGDVQAAQLREARERGDLSTTFEALRATHGAWDRRWFLLTRLSASTPRAAFEQLVLDHPADPVAYLLRGIHAIRWGWQARGGHSDASVDDEGARLFKQRLQLAEADLRHAAALDPADPNPWSWLLAVAIGNGWDQATARHAFEQARQADPQYMPAYRRMLQYESAKWHGSHERMHEFARWAADGAPAGSELHTLVIEAHLEHWFAIDRAQGVNAARAYGAQAQVHEAVQYARAMSVHATAHQPRAWSHIPLHHLAEWFYLNHDRRSLTDELRALGDRIDPSMFGGGAQAAKYVASMSRYASNAAERERKAKNEKRQRMWAFGGLGVIIVASFLWVLVSEVWSYAEPRMRGRIYARNSTEQGVNLVVDGGEPTLLGAFEAVELDVGSGEHTVHATDAETGQVVDDGRFETPPSTMLWLFHRSGLYDVGGQGRYASVRVTYDGARARVTNLGSERHFVTFPEAVTRVQTFFPDSARRGTVIEAVCARSPSGSLPCLR